MSTSPETVPEPHDAFDESARIGGDSSANRVLGILDLFSVERPIWSADMLIAELKLGRATVYRYLKALHDAGFLVPSVGGGYVLGPRFIEFDRQIRLSDPLLKVAPSIMTDYREDVSGVQTICGFYGDRVLSVYMDRVDPDLLVRMERGRPFPLLFGSPTRIIVAFLPSYQLKALLISQPKTIADAGLGTDWPSFRRSMKAIRTLGYCVGKPSNVDVFSVAAPIFSMKGQVIASIYFARRQTLTSEQDEKKMIGWATEAATRISAELQKKPLDSGRGMAESFPVPRLGRT